MAEDSGFWFPQLQFDLQSPTSKFVGAPLHLEQDNASTSFMNPGANIISINGSSPAYPVPELSDLRASQLNEPHGWFYCLPRCRQAFRPALSSVLRDKLLAAPYSCHKEAIMPKETIIPMVESGCSQKRFLVFDQSGDQTTLMFSSGTEIPIQYFTSLIPKPTGAYNLNRELRDNAGVKDNLNLHLGPISTDKFGEKNETDLHSEMHEDTEELNALLYSDGDSDYTEDDEVTSTGHSPSTMTAHDKQDWFEGNTEVVASSDGSSKKRKLFDGGYSDVPSLVDTASSVKPIKSSEYEDDAESRCTNGINLASDVVGYELCCKRMRKEKIRDTVSILQNLIPGVQGKDAIEVIDEAINYLKFLKLKATALGFESSKI